jgi:hypothetical protein
MIGDADLDAVDRNALERCMEIAQRERSNCNQSCKTNHGSRSRSLPSTVVKSNRCP